MTRFIFLSVLLSSLTFGFNADAESSNTMPTGCSASGCKAIGAGCKAIASGCSDDDD